MDRGNGHAQAPTRNAAVVQQEVGNAAQALARGIDAVRNGTLSQPDRGLKRPRPKQPPLQQLVDRIGERLVVSFDCHLSQPEMGLRNWDARRKNGAVE